MLHEACELLTEGLSGLSMCRHSYYQRPLPGYRALASETQVQAAELDSMPGGTMCPGPGWATVYACHLGRSLKFLFWVRGWRNKSHLCWVYASVSPALK